MSTTTEPAWLHQSSGVAPRNGTNTHTIDFGWTAGTGTLLAVLVFGGVTNTAAGWTERLQPVNSCELSLFTTDGAGQSSITVTHNGSNYPVNWIAYEFPVGSSYTAGVGNNTTSNTFPTLPGLPGAAQVVIAARGRGAWENNVTASSTWPAPWVEDCDILTPWNTTDGCYLTVAHQLNVTTTSVTPTATTTASGTVANDIEHIVAAFDVPAATSGVTGELSAALPALAAAVTGSLTTTGQVDASLTSPTVTATATVTIEGQASANLPALSASLVAELRTSGALDATLPALETVIDGSVSSIDQGEVAATLPTLTASISGSITIDGTLSASLPRLEFIAVGEVGSLDTGTLEANLPRMTAAIEGSVTVPGQLSASIPLPALSADGAVTINATVAATLPGLTFRATTSALFQPVANPGLTVIPPGLSLVLTLTVRRLTLTAPNLKLELPMRDWTQNDTAPPFRAVCTKDGKPTSIVGGDPMIHIRKPDDTLIVRPPTAGDQAAGEVEMDWQVGDLDEPGVYSCAVKAGGQTFGDRDTFTVGPEV